MATPPLHLNKTVDRDLQIRVGDILIYTFEQHSSVGYEGEYFMDDKNILQFIGEEVVYHTPKQMQKFGITGADGASGKFIFKAVAVGKTKLIVQQLFRFKIETELIFNITIT